MNRKTKTEPSSHWKLPAFAAAVFVLSFFLLGKEPPAEGAEARISINGETVMELRLSDVGDSRFSLREEYGVPVDFEIKEQRIRFINVECPDHICEKTGFVGTEGEAAVCMPNKTYVVIS